LGGEGSDADTVPSDGGGLHEGGLDLGGFVGFPVDFVVGEGSLSDEVVIGLEVIDLVFFVFAFCLVLFFFLFFVVWGEVGDFSGQGAGGGHVYRLFFGFQGVDTRDFGEAFFGFVVFDSWVELDEEGVGAGLSGLDFAHRVDDGGESLDADAGIGADEDLLIWAWVFPGLGEKEESGEENRQIGTW